MPAQRGATRNSTSNTSPRDTLVLSVRDSTWSPARRICHHRRVVGGVGHPHANRERGRPRHLHLGDGDRRQRQVEVVQGLFGAEVRPLVVDAAPGPGGDEVEVLRAAVGGVEDPAVEFGVVRRERVQVNEVRPRVLDEHERPAAELRLGVAPRHLGVADRAVVLEPIHEEWHRRTDEHGAAEDGEPATAPPGGGDGDRDQHAEHREQRDEVQGRRDVGEVRRERDAPEEQVAEREDGPHGEEGVGAAVAPPEPEADRGDRDAEIAAHEERRKLDAVAADALHGDPRREVGRGPARADAARAEAEGVARVGRGDGELREAPGHVPVVRQGRDEQR